MYDVQCTTYSVRRTMYDIQCTTYNIRRTVYDVQCTTYSVRRTLYDVQCTTYSVRHIVYDIHCTTYSVRRPDLYNTSFITLTRRVSRGRYRRGHGRSGIIALSGIIVGYNACLDLLIPVQLTARLNVRLVGECVRVRFAYDEPGSDEGVVSEYTNRV